ncbi:MAG TPA: PAS domain S-box protein, partial [Bacteroidia bacterium]|nr:PAS domain S-box protein [Bacteroidia bacterium]
QKGDYIFVEGYVTNLLHLQGINAIVSNFRDVTARVKVEKKLEESRKKYRLVYENPFLGIAFGTIDGKFLDVNDAFAKMLGYTSDELYNMHFSKITLGEDVEKELSALRKMDTGEIDNFNVEKRYITKSEKIIWAELNLTCVKNETGKIEFIMAVIQNITSRKKAEESLQKSEANLRNIFENTDTAYVLMDEQANVLSYNNIAQELAMTAMSEVLETGKNYVTLMLPERRTEVSETIKNVLRKKEPISYDIKYVIPGKADKWLAVSMHPIFDHDEKVLGLSVAATDITKTKNTEQLIKLSNERYELVTKATNDVIWDWDIVSNKIYRSENYKQLFGYYQSSDNIYSRSLETHVHPDDSERILDSITQKIEDPNASLWEDEYRYYRSNGELAYIQDRGYIIYDENKKPVRMVGAMRDITAKKLSAIERDKITSDLIRQNKDLEQFAYIISHNLRAPVANILGLSQIIQSENLDEYSYKMSLSGLSSSVQKLDNIIVDLNKILQVKREINEKKESVQFSMLVDDIKLSVRHFLEEEEVLIYTDFSIVNEIFTLKSYLHSIFYNLIANSIKYRSPDRKPVIEITSRETDNFIVLIFKDNGIGIDLKANGDKIFGLYKRFHLNVEGRGMGLFMVKTQVETLSGKITVSSEINKGTQFVLEFEKQLAPIHIPETIKNTERKSSISPP